MKKYLWIVLSLFFLGLAFLGAFLPLLPTVPFLLLAVFCASQGSERLERKIRESSFYRKHLETYVEERSLLLPTKIKILSFASIFLALAFYFSKFFWARIIILVFWISKMIYFIFFIETKREKEGIVYD